METRIDIQDKGDEAHEHSPAELLKEYVQSQHFTSTADIMSAMKEMFRDVIQTVMEVEMDEELGRQRCQRSDAAEGTPRNYRNGYSKKTVKMQLGEVDIKVPRDRNGSYVSIPFKKTTETGQIDQSFRRD